MNHTCGDGGTTLRHLNLGDFKFTGLLYCWIKIQISEKLFELWKCWKVTELTHDGYSRQGISNFECFNQMNLLDKVSIFIRIYKLVEWFKNAVDFFIIFTYEANIKANTIDVAVYNVSKLICISCCLNYGAILILSTCKPKSSCWFDDINNLLLVCFKKSWWRCIGFQMTRKALRSKTSTENGIGEGVELR